MEKVLYIAIFISFGIAFLLFASSYKYNKPNLKRGRKIYFYFANLAATVLLVLTFISFNNCIDKNEFWEKSSQARAKVFKIDPEGYQKQRTIYYIFEHNGKIYKGHKNDEAKKYKIGDSITVMYSQIRPEENKVKPE